MGVAIVKMYDIVRYKPPFGVAEIGKVSGVNDGWLFVVFEGAGDTAAACRPEQLEVLQFGSTRSWPFSASDDVLEENESLREKVEELQDALDSALHKLTQLRIEVAQ